jgi:hypothetical protein
MLDNVRRYIDATVAVATMATFGIISGFVAAGVTGDRTVAFLTAVVAFALTGAVLMVRLWRLTRIPLPPPDPVV